MSKTSIGWQSTSAKPPLKRAATILAEKSSSFEDSRITLLLFEKYRLMEITRFWMIFACQILAILEYETTFKDQFLRQYEGETTLLLYLIFFMTLMSGTTFTIIVVLTLVSYQVNLGYQKKAQMITQHASLLETNLIYGLLIEILLILPCPTPFTQHIKVSFKQRYTMEDRYYYVNEILTYILTFRVLLVINIVLKFQGFYSSQIGRLCRLYSTPFDTHLVFKICMKDLPSQTLMGLFTAGMLLFGYSLEIAERSLKRSEFEYESYNVNNSLWITMITISTAGYGDFFPISDLGRLSMAICVIWGVSNTSLFTAMLYSMLQAEGSEEMVWALLDKANVRNTMAIISQRLFVGLRRLRMEIEKKPQVMLESNKVQFVQETLQTLSQFKRAYRDIDGEETMMKAKRKFKDICTMFEEFAVSLKEVKRLQLIIAIHQQYAWEQQLNSSAKKNQSSPHRLTYQTDDKQSKDEAFFANLQDNESDLLLMDFHD